MSAVRLEGVTKSYRAGEAEVPVLSGVDLEVADGESIAITGASGSGKSTLMHIMGLLDSPSAGTVTIGGREMAAMDDDEMAAMRNVRIGFVFQAFHLMPRLDASDNVALPLLYRGIAREEARPQARAMLEHMGLAAECERFPSTLSGGQKQRVAIARALVGEPDIVLADEPTGALDPATGTAVLETLLAMGERRGACVVLITHDAKVAARCRRTVELRRGALIEVHRC